MTGGAGQENSGFSWRSVALLVGGMACFGSATPISAIVGRDYPLWLGAAMRLAIATLVLTPFVVGHRARHRVGAMQLRDVSWPDRLRILAMGIVGTFLFSVLMVAGMHRASGSVGAVVMGATPAVTAVCAFLVLHERLGRRQMIAVGLAVAGVVLVNVAGGGGAGRDVLVGSLLVFGAVCCEALYTILGKQLSAEIGPIALTIASAAVAVVAFSPIAIAQAISFDWSRPSITEWVALAWWGVGTMALGSSLWFAGLARVRGASAAPFMGVMPISALVLSWILLGDRVTWYHPIGVVLVLIGLAVTSTGSNAEPADEADSDHDVERTDR